MRSAKQRNNLNQPARNLVPRAHDRFGQQTKRIADSGNEIDQRVHSILFIL